MPVDRSVYRDAMARLGAAVNVVATDGPAGRAGFTASAVCSVTDEPPTLLVCANRANDSYPAMRANGVLCVSTLTADQQAVSPLFAGLTDHSMAGRFEACEWETLLTGSPVLRGAAVAFDCRIDQVVEVGTHDVFFCLVEAVGLGEADAALIYFGRLYYRLPKVG